MSPLDLALLSLGFALLVSLFVSLAAKKRQDRRKKPPFSNTPETKGPRIPGVSSTLLQAEDESGVSIKMDPSSEFSAVENTSRTEEKKTISFRETIVLSDRKKTANYEDGIVKVVRAKKNKLKEGTDKGQSKKPKKETKKTLSKSSTTPDKKTKLTKGKRGRPSKKDKGGFDDSELLLS